MGRGHSGCVLLICGPGATGTPPSLRPGFPKAAGTRPGRNRNYAAPNPWRLPGRWGCLPARRSQAQAADGAELGGFLKSNGHRTPWEPTTTQTQHYRGHSGDGFLWEPNSFNMHVIRPKSAKGRKRRSLHGSQGMEEGSLDAPSSPPPPCSSVSPSSQKPRACGPIPPSPRVPDELSPKLLQQVPIGTSSSLNKYPVLPSINRRNLEEGSMDAMTRALQKSSIRALCRKEPCTNMTNQEDAGAPAGALGRKCNVRGQRQSISRAANREEQSAAQEARLLLAVRAPSGQRLVHYFRPTDDLRAVIAVAEEKNKATYRRCSVETMEVPRRRFSDLTKSLQECGILHKSVLIISPEEGEGEP